uniref:DDE-1 domain-containing protein n=1 Tax=Daphnia galeata TaxID=27404 RepID=A0A8J2WSZ1_9CRUS|nr:unnamed protein product [Daphnia galeata]
MLLTFPPHCSHALQPLDVCVYSLFKRALGASYNEWLQLNPCKRLILKEIAELTRSAYVAAFTPANIISAFVSTGILPFNRLAIADERYAPSLITDRDCPIVSPRACIFKPYHLPNKKEDGGRQDFHDTKLLSQYQALQRLNKVTDSK